MNKQSLSVLVLAMVASTAAMAEEESMTLQQQRDQIGAEMEESRRQTDRDINDLRQPGSTRDPAEAAQADRLPRPESGVGGSAPGAVPNPGTVPAPGAAGDSGDASRPITTTTPGADTTERGAPTTTGTPIAPIEGSGANGNASPGAGTGTGENGTGAGNGGAAGGNSTGGAAGGSGGN